MRVAMRAMSAASFFVHRGLTQLRIEAPADLDRVPELDAARWSATSVPNEQLFCDPAFLAAVDTDRNGRIRRHEVLSALAWLRLRLAERARMFTSSDAVRLADLDVTHPDIVRILQLARQRLGKGWPRKRSSSSASLSATWSGKRRTRAPACWRAPMSLRVLMSPTRPAVGRSTFASTSTAGTRCALYACAGRRRGALAHRRAAARPGRRRDGCSPRLQRAPAPAVRLTRSARSGIDQG